MNCPHYAGIVGRALRMRREIVGISLSAFAREMGITTSGWSRVETGDTVMTVAQLSAACHVLAVDPWQIIRHADALTKELDGAALSAGARFAASAIDSDRKKRSRAKTGT
jgi:transcriptional regulator with XRE-family HTH domain